MTTATRLGNPVAKALSDRSRTAASGILTARYGRLVRLICYEKGWIVHTASNMVEEQLGEYLIKRKILSPGVVATAKVKAIRREVKFARHLRDEAILDEAALNEALEGHAHEIVAAAIDCPDSELEFASGRANLDDEIPIRISCIAAALRYTARNPTSLDQVRVRIGPPNMRPKLMEDTKQMLDGVRLDAGARYVVENSKGNLDLSSLVVQAPVSTEDTLRALYGLMLIHVIEAIAAEDRKAVHKDRMTREECLARIHRAEDGDHYIVLGVESTANREQVRDAYYFLARRYHPDRFRSGPLKDLFGKMEGYFTKVTEAYNTLYDDSLRKQYDEDVRSRMKPADSTEPEADKGYLAKQNYARAKLLIGKKQYQEALRFLENALDLDDSMAPVHLEMGRVLSRNPRRRADAEKHLLRAAEIDPATVDAYLLLGQVYVKADRADEAAKMFREALRWEPTNGEAQAELRHLAGDKPGDKGILGGLFRG